MGVSVGSGADIGVASKHLRKLQVPGAAQALRDRGMAGLVHRPMGKPGSREAFRPPAVHRGGRELLLPVLPDRPDGAAIELGTELLGIEQVFLRRRGPIEDVPLKRRPQLLVDDRQVAHLPALAENGQVAAVVVLELDARELALPQP